MFQQLTYATKNKLLIAAAILLVYLVYAFAIKNTIAVYAKYKQAQKDAEFINNAPAKTGALEKELAAINSRIGSDAPDGVKIRQVLLEHVSNYCQKNKAILRQFPESTLLQKDGLLAETNAFTVEGTYPVLVKLAYLMEQQYKIGRTASLRFQLKKDFKTQKMALTATIYIQNINQILK